MKESLGRLDGFGYESFPLRVVGTGNVVSMQDDFLSSGPRKADTVIKVYRELEQEGVLEIRHGLGAFVISRRRSRSRAEEMRDAQQLVHEFVDTLKKQGLEEGEIRRLFEAKIAGEFQRR